MPKRPGIGRGGLYVFTNSANLLLTNNTFSGNHADGVADGNGGGGGVFLWMETDDTVGRIYNNIFKSNSNTGGGNGANLLIDSDGDENGTAGSVSLFNNAFSGDADFATAQDADLAITDTSEYTHGGNINNTDPQFADEAGGGTSISRRRLRA